MGFLFPLFLLAGLAVAIPIAIHLFDLRRFRRIVFPATRFLKEVMLQSRRQSRLQQRLLLALRCLFLLSLVLAFAQPFWQRRGAANHKAIAVLVVENGPASGARKEGHTLLESSKETARQIVRSLETPVYLLTASGPVSYVPLSREEAEVRISQIRPVAARKTNESLLAAIQSLRAEEGADEAQVWWVSDFSKSNFRLPVEGSLMENIALQGIQMPAGNAENLWIDTAWTLPQTDPAAEGRIVVRTRSTLPDQTTTTLSARLTANGRFQSATPPRTAPAGPYTDTLRFAGQGSSWQQLELTLSDATGPSFDDTFRLAVRPVKPWPVLVYNQGTPGPYLQAALAASGRFVVTEIPDNAAVTAPEKFSLIVLHGITSLSGELLRQLKPAVARGVPVMVFPGKSGNTDGLEAALRGFVDLHIAGMDTSLQTAVFVQEQNPLLTEIFESIPPNIELPNAGWHYRVAGGAGARGQSILAFRNGDPLLAEYSTGSGKLFLLTTAADAGSGSFARSYFFAPILHAAAASAAGTASLSYTLGSNKAVFIPRPATEGTREVVRMTGGGTEIIPAQRPAAGGIDLYPDGTAEQPGFYRLSGAGADTLYLGLNASRLESLPGQWTLEELRNGWKGKPAVWTPVAQFRAQPRPTGPDAYPLWKISAILALLLLAAETAVLLRPAASVRRFPSPQS